MAGRVWVDGGSRRALALIAVTSALLGAAPGVIGAVVAPQHTPGDQWVYDVVLSSIPGVDQGFENMSLEGSITYRAEGTEEVQVGLRTYTASVFSLSGEGTLDSSLLGANSTASSATWTLSGGEYLEQEGLELVKAEQAWVVTTVVPNPVSSGIIEVELLVNVTLENQILSRTWGYPYDVGDSGEVELNQSITAEFEMMGSPLESEPQTFLGNTTITVECTSRVPTAVPAGTFDTYVLRRVDVSSESVTVDYYSEDVRNLVKREQFDASGELMAQQVLQSYGAESEDGAVLDAPWHLWLVFLLAAVVIAVIALVIRCRFTASQAQIEEPLSEGVAQPAAERPPEQPPERHDEPWNLSPCERCGHPLEPWAEFCSRCGAQFR